ncbi:hypothetical protein TWF718_004275 [Orbilia javanica]|uniref:FFD box profile domain-containing protein n=1 Tax=Orbilia javanica TaxID=47235 RepID=A0AAN8MXL0_9PEZI
MSEFIGSRISLISRSDIRYVGTLHQIDSENSTVGLENVTNHGTEGRCDDPANEVDGTDEVYDYIVFRGSDVKDLRMEAPEAAPKPPPPQPSFPNDPAIINAQRPPGYPPAQQFNYQQNGRPGPNQPPFNPNFAPGFYPPGPMGGPRAGPGGQFYPQPPYIGGFPGGPGGPGFPGPFPYGVPQFPPGPQAPGQGPPPPQGDNRNRAAPQTGAQPQPQTTSAPPPQAKGEHAAAAAESKDVAPEPKGAIPTQQPPPPPLESKPDVATALAQPTTVAPTQPTGPRNAGTRGRGARGRGAFGSSQPGHTQTGTTITTTTTTIAPVVPVVQPALVPVQPAADSPGLADLERKVQAMKLKQTNGMNQQYRQNNNNGPIQYRGRGRGRGGMPHQPRKVDVPTTDYDFELANARFTKVADGEDGASTSDAPEGSAERKQSVDQPAIIAPAGGFYNKGSSFFDNISCENKERAEAKETGADGRPGGNRRGEEVRKNIETFGQGSVDSGYRRGNWRGRGGRGRGHYRGRGRGGGQQQQQQNQPQSQSQPVRASG